MYRKEFTEELALRSVVDNWIKAYTTKDLNLVKTIFSDAKNCFHYGTGVDEKIEGLSGMISQLERDWSQSEKCEMKCLDFRSQMLGLECAWIACELQPIVTITGKVHEFPALRSTLVVLKKEGEWKIQHSHASWPYLSQKEGESFPKD